MEENSIIGNERLIMVISTSLATGENKLLRNEIKILSTLTEDIYLTYHQASKDDEGKIDSVEINVKIFPLMRLLWSGMWLMILGMILRIASEKKLPKDSKLKKTKENTELYYEDLVEEELKKQRR